MKKLNVLIVDDDEVALAGLKEELSSEPYAVKTALGGKNALEKARRDRPDVVITDLVMPGINGVEVCRGIKTMYPDTEVVFISGHPTEIERFLLEFVNAGGRDEFLRKPLVEDELSDVLKKIKHELIGRVGK